MVQYRWDLRLGFDLTSIVGEAPNKKSERLLESLAFREFDLALSRGDCPRFLVYPLLLTTEQMEHTEANPYAVMPFFRVFSVFRGSLFSATRTPGRPVTLIARGLSPVSCPRFLVEIVPRSEFPVAQIQSPLNHFIGVWGQKRH